MSEPTPGDPTLDQFEFDEHGAPLTERRIRDGYPSMPTMPRQEFRTESNGPTEIKPFGTIDPWEQGEHRGSMKPLERELTPIRSIYEDDEQVDADPKVQVTKLQHPSES